MVNVKNICDLIVPVPLAMPLIQEMSHEINLIDPSLKPVCISSPKMSRCFASQTSQEIKKYTVRGPLPINPLLLLPLLFPPLSISLSCISNYPTLILASLH
jgi:hypothetical protein